MKTFGLIGYPLGHSWSAGYFSAKFEKEGISDVRYVNFPLEQISLLPELLQGDPTLAGLNETIPYKEKVIPYLDALEGAAQEIGAVNCISVKRSPKGIQLTGHNTDAVGFEQSIESKVPLRDRIAMILGTGGAAKAAAWVLQKNGCNIIWVSRRPSEGRSVGYDAITRQMLSECTLIINTTPLGMMPLEEGFPPIPYHWLESKQYLFDMVYNPTQTVFLKKGVEMGCTTISGLDMLHRQAEAAWSIWNRR